MRRRFLAVVGATMCLAFVLIVGGPALACGGLIGPNGGVSLVKTTTLAGYHDGVEHYVTAFSFTGGTGNFGSIVPLPGVPTKVEKGGNWTLQRLVKEVTPQPRFAAGDRVAAMAAVPSPAEVLQHLVDPQDLPGAVVDQPGTVAGQVPEALHHGGGDEAALKQPALQQLGEPLGILHIGLAPGSTFSQSRSSRNPWSKAENSRTFSSRLLPSPGLRTHAITVLWCTSSPAQRSTTTSMTPPSSNRQQHEPPLEDRRRSRS